MSAGRGDYRSRQRSSAGASPGAAGREKDRQDTPAALPGGPLPRSYRKPLSSRVASTPQPRHTSPGLRNRPVWFTLALSEGEGTVAGITSRSDSRREAAVCPLSPQVSATLHGGQAASQPPRSQTPFLTVDSPPDSKLADKRQKRSLPTPAGEHGVNMARHLLPRQARPVSSNHSERAGTIGTPLRALSVR